MEQYVLGERFVNEVVEQRGIEFLERVWASKENLPLNGGNPRPGRLDSPNLIGL